MDRKRTLLWASMVLLSVFLVGPVWAVPGTIKLIGTPAEEKGGGKVIMVERGVFDERSSYGRFVLRSGAPPGLVCGRPSEAAAGITAPAGAQRSPPLRAHVCPWP